VPFPAKATDEQLVAAYAELGSVHKVGERFGMRGTSAHERLTKLGVIKPMNVFTEEEKDRLRRDYNEYAGRGRLHLLAEEMGRSETFICAQARMLELTQIGRPRADKAQFAERTSKAWKKHGHPRGMLGKKHTPENLDLFSQLSFERWHSMSEEAQREFQSHGTRSWKAGWREIGGKRHYYRSRWEANYALYLEWLKSRGEILDWEYEPTTFWFEKIKRGVRSYKPDFRVHEVGGAKPYHEVKGWMDSRSRTTLKRMAKYHPNETVIVIDRKAYNAIARTASSLLEGWE
jgi:hypothetical protein